MPMQQEIRVLEVAYIGFIIIRIRVGRPCACCERRWSRSTGEILGVVLKLEQG